MCSLDLCVLLDVDPGDERGPAVPGRELPLEVDVVVDEAALRDQQGSLHLALQALRSVDQYRPTVISRL